MLSVKIFFSRKKIFRGDAKEDADDGDPLETPKADFENGRWRTFFRVFCGQPSVQLKPHVLTFVTFGKKLCEFEASS